LAQEAMNDVSFMLRTAHLQKLKTLLNDPEATDNDRFVAYNLLQNAAVAIEGQLPSCQDTGTAIVWPKKVKTFIQVWMMRMVIKRNFQHISK
jgi:fumarate hydratase, class I